MPTDFQPGDAVTVTGGSFERFTGIVEGPRDGGIMVVITIYGRSTPIVVAPELLRQKRPDDQDPPVPGM